jgi:16S rRNA (guanine527-N7)-methyltransferase
VNGSVFEARLHARADAAGVDIDRTIVPRLNSYLQVLARWNQRINLTALPLDPLTDAAIDRLLIEPLAAAAVIPKLPGSSWMDVGSGAGSPALPMAVAREDLRLTMVESKARKAAFLREAARTMGVSAVVEDVRAEALVDRFAGHFAVLTVRAVRADAALVAVAGSLLMDGGVLALFGPGDATRQQVFDTSWDSEDRVALLCDGSSTLTLLRRVSRET